MKQTKTTTVAFFLAGTFLVSACAPVIRPRLEVPVLTGTAFDTAQKLPVEQLDATTPPELALTFRSCQGGAVRAFDVRQVGPQQALTACLKAVRYEQQQRTYQQWQIVAVPVSLFVTYFATREVGCFFLKTLGGC